jgi:hypothetical protein
MIPTQCESTTRSAQRVSYASALPRSHSTAIAVKFVANTRSDKPSIHFFWEVICWTNLVCVKFVHFGFKRNDRREDFWTSFPVDRIAIWDMWREKGNDTPIVNGYWVAFGTSCQVTSQARDWILSPFNSGIDRGESVCTSVIQFHFSLKRRGISIRKDPHSLSHSRRIYILGHIIH